MIHYFDDENLHRIKGKGSLQKRLRYLNGKTVDDIKIPFLCLIFRRGGGWKCIYNMTHNEVYRTQQKFEFDDFYPDPVSSRKMEDAWGDLLLNC